MLGYFERKRREERKHAITNFAAGAAIGSTIGCLLALLFAPKSGKELRGDIADTATHTYDKIKEAVSETINEARHKIGDFKKGHGKKAVTELSESKDEE